jgi:hypothetical protein
VELEMATEDSKQVLLSLILSLETLSYVRNQDEKQLTIDISDNEDFNNQTFTLQQNTSVADNVKSSKTLKDVDSFLYVYSPYPIKGIFTKADGTNFTLNLVDLLIMRDAFTSVVLTNLSTEDTASIKVIYS